MGMFYRPLCVLSCALLALASCLSNNDSDSEATLYSDAALTSFGISTARIYTHTKSQSGADSVYVKTNSSMSVYPFSINQLTGEVTNADSLPYGTDPTRMLVAFSTKNSGVAAICSLTDNTPYQLSTTDSIDFSTPRNIEVRSTDGTAVHSYTVTVNIHQQKGDSVRWEKTTEDSRFANLVGMKAINLGNSVYVYGSDGTSAHIYSASNDGTTWDAVDGQALGADAYKNVAVRHYSSSEQTDTLFVLDNGKVFYSNDGETFNYLHDATGIKRLVGASTRELYAIADDGSLMVSTDNGASWLADSVGSSMAYMPTADMGYVYNGFEYGDGIEYLMLTGNRSATDYADDSKAVVWSRICDSDAKSKDNVWMCVSENAPTSSALPRLSNLCVLPYANVCLAFGGAGIGKCDNEAFSHFYVSRDGGITWQIDTAYSTPDDFDKSCDCFAATADQAGNVWIICGGSGQVWRMTKNSAIW